MNRKVVNSQEDLPFEKYETADGKKWFKTTADCSIQIQLGYRCTLIVEIDDGYAWDGASIPEACQSLVGKPDDKRWLLPSLLHDWQCQYAKNHQQRRVGDSIFLFNLRGVVGIETWKSWAMWAAVRIYGRFFWKPKLLSPAHISALKSFVVKYVSIIAEEGTKG